MAVFRVERNTGYTVMSNHHLRNKELSLKAKGLLSQMERSLTRDEERIEVLDKMVMRLYEDSLPFQLVPVFSAWYSA